MSSTKWSNAAEHARLAQLWSSRVLKPRQEPRYDELVTLAAGICQSPVAMIELLDADRVLLKARVGTSANETRREASGCELVVALRAPLTVRDVTKDLRFSVGELAPAVPSASAYLGVPLEMSSGAVLGSLAVVDVRPRSWTPKQVEALSILGRQVVAQMELTRSACDNAELWSSLQAFEIQLNDEREARTRAAESLCENGICQDLAGLLYLLQAAMHDEPDASRSERLNMVRELIREMLNRYASAPHLSLDLPYRGLRGALESHARTIQEKTGVACNVHWMGTVDIRNRLHADHLFRIAHCAVTRASRQPGCRLVSIRIRPMIGRVVLEIEGDEGTPVAAPPAEEKIWVELMRFMVSAIPAKLDIFPRGPLGGKVRCVLYTAAAPMANLRHSP